MHMKRELFFDLFEVEQEGPLILVNESMISEIEKLVDAISEGKMHGKFQGDK